MYEQYPLQNTQQNIPQEPQREPVRSHSRRSAAALLCACLAVSGVMGFGGGYFAGTLQQSQQAEQAPVVLESTKMESNTPAIPAAVSEAMTVSQLVDAVSESVVEINTNVETTNFFMQQVTAQAAGSGVIIQENGYIVTNCHVVEGASDITVRLKNGESYPAKLIGSDSQTDLAVIKIEAEGLKVSPMGNSSALQVGEEAIAIGNPLGELGGTVTNGIVSALDREITVGNETMTLLQTNAAISPGNSGGGLYNNKGELIGIVVAKASGSNAEGLGFAIPIDIVKDVTTDLIANGYVTGRGELGVSVINISNQQAAFMYRVPQTGVYVAGIQDGSAAQQAGLKTADGILAVEDVEISSSDDLRKELQKHKAGDSVQLTILRDGRKETVSVTLQESVPEEIKEQRTAI